MVPVRTLALFAMKNRPTVRQDSTDTARTCTHMRISRKELADLVLLDAPANDWREAIRLAARPLVRAGYIEEAYIAAMERVADEFGPYFVLAPGVALAHARPEGHVNRSGISLCRLAGPVPFGHEENDPVWLVVVLAGSTDDSHLGLLSCLARFLGDSESLGKVRHAGSARAVAEVLAPFLTAAPGREATGGRIAHSGREVNL